MEIYSIHALFQALADCLEMNFQEINEDYSTCLGIPYVFHHLIEFVCVLKNIPLSNTLTHRGLLGFFIV